MTAGRRRRTRSRIAFPAMPLRKLHRMKPARPMLCSAHPSIFNALEIERFEAEIILNPKATEHDASRFFETYPKFLLLGQGKEVRREVVLVGSKDKPIGRVDFFRKNFGSAYWDVVELKPPTIRFVSGVQSKHPYLAAGVHKAVSQAQDYRHLIDESPTLRKSLREKGILLRRPGMIVIAGRRNEEVSPELIVDLTERIRSLRVELLTYDFLLEFAKEHYRSNQVIVCPASVVVSKRAWAVFRKDREGRFTFANREFLDLLNTDEKSIVGLSDSDIFPEAIAKAYQKADIDVVQNAQGQEQFETHIKPRGKRNPIRIVKTALFDTNGKVAGVETRFCVIPFMKSKFPLI